MNPTEYMAAVMVTESKDFTAIEQRLQCPAPIRALHAACGIANESGELMELIKKYVFYGKQPDPDDLVEEYGDLLWYIALGLKSIGATFEEVMERNIAKLKARYKDGEFDAALALERNREAEREALRRR